MSKGLTRVCEEHIKYTCKRKIALRKSSKSILVDDMRLMLIELSMIVIVIWSFIINKKLILTPEVVAKRNRKKTDI